MKVLVLAPNYPYPGYRFSGIFNQRSVIALSEQCERIGVLVPCPYVPPVLTLLVPRWKAYGSAPEYESQDRVAVYRPRTPVIPGVAQAFWSDQARFLWSRRTVRQMQRHTRFNAIISFDLMGAGGLAWRLGRDLQLPSTGWATGTDIRFSASSGHGRAVKRALQNLDLVFYQSQELLEKAAELLGVSRENLSGDRHIVLSRGIPEPPQICKVEARNRIRAIWGIRDDEVLVLYLGRISRKKGMLELIEALTVATSKDSRIRCVLIGSKPAFDDTSVIEKKLRQQPQLSERVVLLPECSPDSVWENLCAADLFAFPSHKEGMPNSLLEAMAMGVPAVAFAIPPVQELEAGTGGLFLVPPMDVKLFAEAVLHLSARPKERMKLGEKGKALVMERFMMRKSMGEVLRRVSLLIEETRPPDKPK